MYVAESGQDVRDYNLSQYLPKQADISSVEYMLPLPDKSIVLNQYSTPTCVGQACAMAKMITEYMMTNKWIGLSPYSIYGYYNNNGGGMGVRYGIEVLYKYGCLPLSEFSEIGDNPELHTKLKKYWSGHPNHNEIANKYRIDSYAGVRGFNEIKQAIAAGMPVVGSVYAQQGFGRRNGGIEPNYPQGATVKHAVCFVGWKMIDDQEYLIAINSWGERNGDKGKVYIPNRRKLEDTFLISDSITPIKRKCKNLEFFVGSPRYKADDEIKQFDSIPYIKDGRTFLPVRFVAENLGASVEWNPQTSVATLRSEEATISISNKSSKITINGIDKSMDVAPEIVKNRLMCPIRFVAEALGCRVSWEEKRGLVKISAL